MSKRARNEQRERELDAYKPVPRMYRVSACIRVGGDRERVEKTKVGTVTGVKRYRPLLAES